MMLTSPQFVRRRSISGGSGSGAGIPGVRRTGCGRSAEAGLPAVRGRRDVPVVRAATKARMAAGRAARPELRVGGGTDAADAGAGAAVGVEGARLSGSPALQA